MIALVVFVTPVVLFVGWRVAHRRRVAAGRAEGPLRGRDTGISRRGPKGLMNNRRGF